MTEKDVVFGLAMGGVVVGALFLILFFPMLQLYHQRKMMQQRVIDLEAPNPAWWATAGKPFKYGGYELSPQWANLVTCTTRREPDAIGSDRMETVRYGVFIDLTTMIPFVFRNGDRTGYRIQVFHSMAEIDAFYDDVFPGKFKYLRDQDLMFFPLGTPPPTGISLKNWGP